MTENEDSQELAYDYVHRLPPADSGFRTFDVAQLDTLEEATKMLNFFQEEGYIVVDNILTEDEIEEAKDKFALLMKVAVGLDLENPTVEALDEIFADPERGIAGHSGVGHSAMNWFVRSRERVQQAFALTNQARYAPPHRRSSSTTTGRKSSSQSGDAAPTVVAQGSSSAEPTGHEEQQDIGLVPHDKLITSFDGLNYFRNPEINPSWTPSQESWLHFDASHKEHTTYVQGLVNLIDCTHKNDAGLVIFPRSHRSVFPCLVAPSFPPQMPSFYIRMIGDKWAKVKRDSKAVSAIGDTRAFRVPLKAGSLVMWGSATMHCNMGPLPRGDDSAQASGEGQQGDRVGSTKRSGSLRRSTARERSLS